MNHCTRLDKTIVNMFESLESIDLSCIFISYNLPSVQITSEIFRYDPPDHSACHEGMNLDVKTLA